LSIGGTQSVTAVRYVIDAKGSRFTVRAFATGMLAAFAHSPTIAIPDFAGEVTLPSGTLEDASFRLVIQAASLAVIGDVRDKDRDEIEHRIRDEVLEVDAFGEIIYECPRISSAQKLNEGQFVVKMDGELALHGVSRHEPISARVTLSDGTLHAAGEFSVRQSDYEIKPVTAAGGAIKLKDELKLSFDITARKQP